MEYTFTLTKMCVCVCVCVCARARARAHVCIKLKLLFLVNKTFLQKTKVIHLALNIKRIFKLFYICVISNPKKLFKDFFVQPFKLCTITKITSVTHSPKTIGRGLSSRSLASTSNSIPVFMKDFCTTYQRSLLQNRPGL